jgi:hypothetical protein
VELHPVLTLLFTDPAAFVVAEIRPADADLADGHHHYQHLVQSGFGSRAFLDFEMTCSFWTAVRVAGGSTRRRKSARTCLDIEYNFLSNYIRSL